MIKKDFCINRPISQKGEIILDNWGYFTEDILQISKMDLENGRWYIPEKCLIIDLGWYPDSDSYGEYSLKLVIVREDHSWDIIKVNETRDRFEIRDTIEEWLHEHIQLQKF